ncbi:hypothetical protein FHS45_002448 [Thalassobacillus devorans]|uniref:NERD domain-containing protein n=1 Tax=Thalassobacillus devorans TaxID=279813 RepID=UPI0009E9FF6F|nr:NERD domain-containing protein [Thalassobacillus devorans]NIK29347.1 hypothetical protein [Thalassobacillus devorans]
MKIRSKTIEHLQLEALLRRLPPSHKKWSEVESHLLRHSAGHFGETTADVYLQYLPRNRYHVLQDLRLFDGIRHFQIDALIITTSFILIMEVKNLRGKLIFDLEHHQLFRTYQEKQDIFPDPFLQVEHQTLQLTRWLQTAQFPDIPIHSFILIANPNTTIKTHGRDTQQYKRRIIRPKLLFSEVEKLHSRSSPPVWDSDLIKLAAETLHKANTPFTASLLQRFELTPADLIKGIRCPKCEKFRMERKRAHWFCSSCGHKSEDAHLDTLRDYQLLMGDEISNPEFRAFSCLSSEKVARTLLSDHCPHNNGATRGRKYRLDLVK